MRERGGEAVRWTWGLVILLGFGLVMVVSGIGELIDQWRYQSNSQITQGTVLTVEFRESGRNSQNPKSTKVTYAFTTWDGRDLRGSDLVNPRTRRQLRAGGPVAVQYLVSDPSANQIDEADEEWVYVSWIGIGLAFLVVILVLSLVATRQAKADQTVSEPATSTT
jgi:hypothetical protein